jgi:hypothetical protein
MLSANLVNLHYFFVNLFNFIYLYSKLWLCWSGSPLLSLSLLPTQKIHEQPETWCAIKLLVRHLENTWEFVRYLENTRG